MKNLICHTASCEHNVKSRCTAGVITVSEKAKCLSKIRREGGVLAQTFADVEAGADFDIMMPSDSIVQCNAVCVFNDNNICGAEHIVVDDGIISTKCKTRQKV